MLSLPVREGRIATWHDRQIIPGTDWAKTIDTHLERASVILLLVSPDFLASDYCYEIKMQRALQRHEANEARVVPIIVHPCDWSHALFAKLACLPRDGKEITTWNNEDLAWNDVTDGIHRVIEDLSQLSTSAPRTSLPAAWSLSFEKVEQAHPAAAGLLRLCAFLAPDAIPEELITKGAAYLGPVLQPVGEDAQLLDEAIAALGAYSLIRRDASTSTMSIHRLVQAVLRAAMNASTQKIWVERAVRAMHATLPPVEHSQWNDWERLVTHALVCAE